MVGSGEESSVSCDIALTEHTAHTWMNQFVYFGLGLCGDRVPSPCQKTPSHVSQTQFQSLKASHCVVRFSLKDWLIPTPTHPSSLHPWQGGERETSAGSGSIPEAAQPGFLHPTNTKYYLISLVPWAGSTYWALGWLLSCHDSKSQSHNWTWRL